MRVLEQCKANKITKRKNNTKTIKECEYLANFLKLTLFKLI